MHKKFIPFAILIMTFGLFYVGNTAHAAECSNQIAGKTRAQLEAELAACDAEIAAWQAELNKTKQESASYQRDVSALTAKINAAQANIRGKNIAISNLTRDISNKEAHISELDRRIMSGKAAIADIIRKTNEINSHSIVEALLSNKDFSEFFVDIDTYASAEKALEELFAELRGVRVQTEAEKAALNRKKQAEAEAKAALEASKREVEVTQAQKKELLAASESKEKTYEQIVADRKARAAQIRTTLFPLRDSVAIPFGTALQYAEAASAKTGIRPALILAILQQESNLGANVGTCVITNLSTGETKSVNSGRVFSNGIHPTRDLPLLQSILSSLGGDPLTTKVSCPIGNLGYGGAMGPAQFIPSTWNIMRSKVAAATGKATPDPWNPQDAIMAMALFLKDIKGSTGDQYIDERTAACRYYSGKTCYSGGRANVGLSYGNQVMAKANNIQTNMIDLLASI